MFAFLQQWARDRFARRVLRALEAEGVTGFAYDRANFQLRAGEIVANLGNVYTEWKRAAWSQRRLVLGNLLNMMRHLHRGPETPGWVEARDRLVAVVRERFFMEAVRLQTREPADSQRGPAHAPFSDFFARCLVLDYPSHTHYVNEENLTEWAMDFEEAWAMGLERLQDSTQSKFRLEQGVFRGDWNDDYDSSRVLLPEMLARLEVRGAPVVCLPNRLTLLVAGSEDPESICRMLAQAEQVLSVSVKPQNAVPLVLRDGHFVDYRPPAGAADFEAVEKVRYLAWLGIYEEQTRLLEEKHAAEGKDLHVGRYGVVRSDQGVYSSYALWGDGMTGLLPQADEIYFCDRPEDPRVLGRAPWARAQEELGDLLLDAGMFPPRFYVSRFPGEERIRRCVTRE
ncbi:MAG: hypothetical protein JSR82_09625 [Verrucomicrobia bacterium]|nr:hypothetical protein [Verrucomicrobiota bacterium]